MSDRNTSNPEIYPQKDHLAPGDDPGEVLRRREGATPPHAQKEAPAPGRPVTDEDNEHEAEDPTE